MIASAREIWTTSLSVLRVRGWTDAEILHAARTLSGTWLLAHPPQTIAIALREHGRWTGVSEERWRGILSEIRREPVVAIALRDLAIEHHRGGTELVSALEDGSCEAS